MTPAERPISLSENAGSKGVRVRLDEIAARVAFWAAKHTVRTRTQTTHTHAGSADKSRLNVRHSLEAAWQRSCRCEHAGSRQGFSLDRAAKRMSHTHAANAHPRGQHL